MTPHEAILTLLMKLALRDGQITPVEQAYLERLAETWGLMERFDALADNAPEFTLDTLLAAITHYPDRFWIAVRAHHLGLSDDEFAARELLLVNALVIRLGITPQDRMLIDLTHADMSMPQICALDPRLAELQAQSTLANPNTWN
jgi:hypothetical protein